MKFTEMLSERWQNAGSMLCVGLDPNPTRFPHELAGRSTALYDFCCGIIDATADLVCAFKPQIAYFASCGAEAARMSAREQKHGYISAVVSVPSTPSRPPNAAASRKSMP